MQGRRHYSLFWKTGCFGQGIKVSHLVQERVAASLEVCELLPLLAPAAVFIAVERLGG